MKQRNTMSHGLIAAAFVAGCTLALNAATVYYTGPGADLADPGNWSGTWTSEDTLFISTNNNVAFPEGGFTLSKDMPASSNIVMRYFPASAVKVECGGHSLNTAILDCGYLHNKFGDRFNPVILSGGFTGVGKIVPSASYDCVYLTNGTFSVSNGFYFNNWYDYTYIFKGAELVVENVSGNKTSGFGQYACSPIFEIDGGRLRIAMRTGEGVDLSYKRQFAWESPNTVSYRGTLVIRNGGEYVDDSVAPADYFHKLSVLIDGGSYIATNSTAQIASHTYWCGERGDSFALTNGTLKVALFGTGNTGYIDELNSGISGGSRAQGTRITFHNSQEIFGNKKKMTKEWMGRGLNSLDGMVFARNSGTNSLVLSGSENVFRSGWFVLGGDTNTVEVADGSFSVTNRFLAYDGCNSVVRFTGGVSSIENMYVTENATNFTVEVAGGAAVNIAELKLDRAAKFRFVVPEEGFAEVPVKCGTTSANGNFRFEFDMSGFTWPDSVSMIPLVYDEGGFAEWGEGGAPLDVAALNEAYAESLPVGSGGKCHFKLGMNGKLLSLSISNGLILYIR